MRARTTKTLHERIKGATRFVYALGNDNGEWELTELTNLQILEATVEHVRSRAVYSLRDAGYSDGQIGEALGVTRQAVSKRWPGGGRYVGAAGRYRTGTHTTREQS
jgi:hypothetical protein